jgi:hypothetical protein
MSLTPPNLRNKKVIDTSPQMLGQGHEEGVRRYSAFPEYNILNVDAVHKNNEMFVVNERASIDKGKNVPHQLDSGGQLARDITMRLGSQIESVLWINQHCAATIK